MRNITIAGGGLAGLSLGVALCRAGIPVVLHEAGRYPRHRVCGEFINGVGKETLSNLGIAHLFSDTILSEETHWFIGSRKVFAGRLERPAIGVSRKWLDLKLAGMFENLGGTLHTGSRQRELRQEGVVWAAGRRGERKSKWLGLKVHVENLQDLQGLEMHMGRSGYVGLAPVEEGRVNVCGLFRLRQYGGKGPEMLWNCLHGNGLESLSERLRQSGPDPSSFTAVSALRFGGQPGNDGVLALGDAESMIPPFTGNGMSMAFEAAETALGPLCRYSEGKASWETVVQDVRCGLTERFRRRLLMARILHPFLLTHAGRAFLSGVTLSGLLPFKALSRTLR